MTPEREQAVGARLRALRLAAGLTLFEVEAKSGVSKSTISEIELTPAGSELAPSAEQLCKSFGLLLVRKYDYDLRRLPERAASKERASEAADSISPSRSGSPRRRGTQNTSSSRATASSASSTSRSGKRRTTTSKRRARLGGR